ncbi:hypothetical protein [Williamsia herbipolensis]|uniref:Secreted protein n=1 Tax=Williamsia herbipolensis TaxID=1603258 RepID=A0AAU4JZE2_9NOCA|nr:hypothetical protein [Williamsia herbipolensis]
MHGLAVLLFPAVLMLFALAMEKMEHQIDDDSVTRDDVEEFLAGAAPEQVGTLATDGFPAALDEFRARRDPVEDEAPVAAAPTVRAS